MTVKVRSIVAIARNGVIGKENALPWPRFKCDMQFFRKTTTGSPIIMGGNTWKSLGRPLPNRLNIVVSKSQNLVTDDNLRVFSSYPEALAFAKSVSETGYVYVIGGKQLYETADTYGVDEYLVSHIGQDYEGDTHYTPPLTGYLVSTQLTEAEHGVEVCITHYKKARSVRHG